MKTSFTICSFFVLIGCNQSDNTIGHWHISRENSDSQNYITMDITADSIAYLGKNSIYKAEEGRHNRKNKTLFFPGDCGVFDFKYKLKQDQIFLESHLEKYIGKRCGANCCNKLIDFKNTIKPDIEFPIIVKNRNNLNPIELENEDFLESIVVGKNKLELAGEISKLNDIGEWIRSINNSYPKSQWKRIIFRVIADKNILLKDLKPIIDELKKHKIERILITCLKESFEAEESMFEYIFLDKFDFESNTTLQDHFE